MGGATCICDDRFGQATPVQKATTQNSIIPISIQLSKNPSTAMHTACVHCSRLTARSSQFQGHSSCPTNTNAQDYTSIRPVVKSGAKPVVP